MSDPIFGINITRVDDEPRPAVASDMAVVGLIGTAPAANAATFPLDTPVFMYSDEATKIASLGLTGTLADAIAGINDQLGEFQVAAKIVVVRVQEGADIDATLVNVLGNAGTKTGLFAFLEAGPLLGVIPRLILAPGFTSQQKKGVGSIAVTAQGAGYTTAPAVSFTGGGGTGATAHAVLGTGPDAAKVVSVVIDNPGTGYTTAPAVAFTGGGGGAGATATATVEKLANPVCAALPPILEKLLAHAVVDGPATTLQDFTDWRETLSSQRLIPVETAVKVGVDASVKPGSPRVVGIGVRRDHEFQGRPFHSWANQAVQGIVGPNRPIDFSLTDGSTEGQTILAGNGGVIVRGEMGVESAIASGGFVYIGTDNCGDDDLWRFYNVTRGRDYIHLLFLRTLRFYLGKFNITGQTVEAIVNTMKFALRDLKADGDILDYKVGFTRDQNSPENLRLGRFTVDFAAEEAPVLRYLGIRSARYRPALDTLLDELLAQIDVAA
ncbi:phage tail protein [Mesorhizobium sp. M2A.F.Ca.ET.039.01.1.1]|uniref:phage tail protein n=1 Tax=Mesorhizobium sp. M2A.F.Ca.ET.039.01.1.1 TaxID=2496746 RepID=UPI000FCC4FC9|nr:phage tail protein [Mesorhizobium sp. M2A.F.Ca.ET.039.01.1.1]RWX72604.1 phage tail protein [Mesorhizobium sp. M2A.F.Ca.ET.039.01.1.1]